MLAPGVKTGRHSSGCVPRWAGKQAAPVRDNVGVNTAQQLNQAAALASAGRDADAKATVRRVLAASPDEPNALRLLGPAACARRRLPNRHPAFGKGAGRCAAVRRRGPRPCPRLATLRRRAVRCRAHRRSTRRPAPSHRLRSVLRHRAPGRTSLSRGSSARCRGCLPQHPQGEPRPRACARRLGHRCDRPKRPGRRRPPPRPSHGRVAEHEPRAPRPGAARHESIALRRGGSLGAAGDHAEPGTGGVLDHARHRAGVGSETGRGRRLPSNARS